MIALQATENLLGNPTGQFADKGGPALDITQLDQKMKVISDVGHFVNSHAMPASRCDGDRVDVSECLR